MASRASAGHDICPVTAAATLISIAPSPSLQHTDQLFPMWMEAAHSVAKSCKPASPASNPCIQSAKWCGQLFQTAVQPPCCYWETTLPWQQTWNTHGQHCVAYPIQPTHNPQFFPCSPTLWEWVITWNYPSATLLVCVNLLSTFESDAIWFIHFQIECLINEWIGHLFVFYSFYPKLKL